MRNPEMVVEKCKGNVDIDIEKIDCMSNELLQE